jgi:hypothetical protein
VQGKQLGLSNKAWAVGQAPFKLAWAKAQGRFKQAQVWLNRLLKLAWAKAQGR